MKRKLASYFLMVLLGVAVSVIPFAFVKEASGTQLSADSIEYDYEFLIGGESGAFTLKDWEGNDISASSYETEVLLMEALNGAITDGDDVHIRFDGTEASPVEVASGKGFEFLATGKECTFYLEGHLARNNSGFSTETTINMSSNSTFFIMSGTYKNNLGYTVYASGNSTLIVNGGLITSGKNSALTFLSSGTLTVNDGTIGDSSSISIYATSSATGDITINGGSFAGGFSFSGYNQTLTVNGGMVTTYSANAIYISETCSMTVNINGGTIEKRIINYSANASINVTGGTFISYGTTSVSFIYSAYSGNEKTISFGGKEITGSVTANIKMPAAGLIYDSQAQQPETASFVLSGLIKGTDYTEEYSDNINAGNAAFSARVGDSIILTTYFPIAKAPQSAPSIPVAKGLSTGSSITLEEIANCEYAISDDFGMTWSEWQDSPMFDGLLENNVYSFVARVKESANYLASEASGVAVISTMIDDLSEEFEDQNFLACIYTQLGKDYGDPLYEDELETIYSLRLYDNGISSLVGIKNLKHLERLECGDNPDLTTLDLSGITSLKYVGIFNCGLKSINLTGLTQLEELVLPSNKLSVIDLTNLVNLVNLIVDDNLLTSLELAFNLSLYYLSC